MSETNYTQAKGLIFQTIRSSFVDGWGIRTTIFLKGCPLRCIWCCNPEGQKCTQELKVTGEKCSSCGACVEQCEKKAITLTPDGPELQRDKCDLCMDCVSACVPKAVEPFARWYTAQEMFQLIVRDKPFFDASGGGLTIGGGEATLYPEFCLGMIQLCHAQGITVAIDTCGYVTTELGMQVLREADFLLYDIKGMDEQRHIENTGVSNRLIQENLRALDQAGQSFIIRYPAIPGYNADDEELHAAARFLTGIRGVKRVDVIPVHRYGEVKYQQLGRRYELTATAMPPERQEEVRAIFASYGFETQLGG
jgi:pyruvate formate lyase activating enzyme